MEDRELTKQKNFMGAFIALPIIAYGIIRMLFLSAGGVRVRQIKSRKSDAPSSAPLIAN